MKIAALILPIVILPSLISCEKEPEQEGNQKPIIEFITPVGDVHLDIGDTLQTEIHAKDSDGVVDEVHFLLDEQVISTQSSSPYQHTEIFSNSGVYELAVTATDDLNASATTDTLIINVTDRDKPTVYFSHNAEYGIDENETIKFTIHAQSPRGEIVKTILNINDSLIITDTVVPYYYEWDSVPAGRYEVFATATDKEGYTSESRKKTIQVRANTLPEAKLEYPQNGSEYLPGSNISIRLDYYSADLVKSEYYVNDSLLFTGTSLGQIDSWTWKNPPFGEHDIYMKLYGENGISTYTDTSTITVQPGIYTHGVVSELEYSEHEDLVFGINKTRNELMLINPMTASMQTVTLPQANPLSMDYDMETKRLYIACEYSGKIIIWDNTNQTISAMSFSEEEDGRFIRVDGSHNRVYVLATDGLYILNQNTGNVLLSGASINGDHFEIDPENQFLFSANQSEYDPSLFKYSIAGDEPELVETNEDIGGGTSKMMAINLQKNYIILPVSTGNDNNHNILAYDFENIQNGAASFNIGKYPFYVNFTADGEKLLGTNNYDDHELYILNSETQQQIDAKEIRNEDRYVRATSNYQSSKLVVFTYDKLFDEDDPDHILYLYDL